MSGAAVLELVPAALLGGLLGLDVVSFPQAMLSRPLVAATLAGALAGQPLAGLLIGATLELIALETLPVGASRYPEWGSAAVVGGTIFAYHGQLSAGAMTTAVVATLATAFVGGWSMVMLRKLNAVRARRLRDGLASGDYESVMGLQLFGMTADFLRGMLLTLLALLVFLPLSRAVVGLWTIDDRHSRAVVVAVAATVAAGAAWKAFHTTKGARWYFLGGTLLGLLLVRAL